VEPQFLSSAADNQFLLVPRDANSQMVRRLEGELDFASGEFFRQAISP
jgi:hypothetical protein